MSERKFVSESYRWGFNGMERDDEFKGLGNSVDFGGRMYDSRLGKFILMDLFANSFPWLSSYQYAGNTPISSVDIDGLEPESVADKQGRLTKPAIHLLHLVSNVDRDVLRQTRIRRRSVFRLAGAPWYNPWPAPKGVNGGAITVGKTIIFTPNFFDKNNRYTISVYDPLNKQWEPQSSSFGDDVWKWLVLLAHEVGHRPQAELFGSTAVGTGLYFIVFGIQYANGVLKGLSFIDAHDQALFEMSANVGREYLLAFLDFDPNIVKIFNDPNLSDEDKITLIDQSFDNFKRTGNINLGVTSTQQIEDARQTVHEFIFRAVKITRFVVQLLLTGDIGLKTPPSCPRF